MAVIKRIHGDCDEKTFYAFIARAKREGLTIAEAFNRLVKDWADGAELRKSELNRERTENFYLKAHR